MNVGCAVYLTIRLVNSSMKTGAILHVLLYVKCAEITADAPGVSGSRQRTSPDNPDRRTHQRPTSSRRIDPAADFEQQRSAAVGGLLDEMNENKEPTATPPPHKKRTSPPNHWNQRLPASKVFTITGCPPSTHAPDRRRTARYTVPVGVSTVYRVRDSVCGRD